MVFLGDLQYSLDGGGTDALGLVVNDFGYGGDGYAGFPGNFLDRHVQHTFCKYIV